MRYVAERSQARTFICKAAAYTGWGEGDLIDLDGLKIVTSEPRPEGSCWVFEAAPAQEVGVEAGSA